MWAVCSSGVWEGRAGREVVGVVTRRYEMLGSRSYDSAHCGDTEPEVASDDVRRPDTAARTPTISNSHVRICVCVFPVPRAP